MRSPMPKPLKMTLTEFRGPSFQHFQVNSDSEARLKFKASAQAIRWWTTMT